MKRKEYNQAGSRRWLASWTLVFICAAVGIVLFALMWLPAQSGQDDSTWRYVDHQVQQLLHEDNGSEGSGTNGSHKQSNSLSNNGNSSLGEGNMKLPEGPQPAEDSPGSLQAVPHKEAIGAAPIAPTTEAVPLPPAASADLPTSDRDVPQAETRAGVAAAGKASAIMPKPKEIARADAGLIYINRASEQELTGLPGIGPSKAKAIIVYREKNGLFKTVKDLLKVKGIGPKLYAKIKDHVSIEP
ncbi:ComEA family DNA-binding protein [Paenibacillus taiwanensis]|uniref:ComEA family DNA-binding protein n=1 Tax=Paenibacillus taiwanensis TaxID=401638 RepID=UPI00040C06AF|nr:helix-hairpin-helix domain-containing protein [Paenibacillus taiwanensis]